MAVVYTVESLDPICNSDFNFAVSRLETQELFTNHLHVSVQLAQECYVMNGSVHLNKVEWKSHEGMNSFCKLPMQIALDKIKN